MRKYVFYSVLFVFIISCSALAQNNLDGFFDIKWGETVSRASNILENKNCSVWTANDKVVLANGIFAGYEGSITLRFNEGKFYNGEVNYDDKTTELDYKQFIDNLKEKYGEPNIKDNIGENRFGERYKYSVWEFKNNCIITLTYYFNLGITIDYENKTIGNRGNVNINDL